MRHFTRTSFGLLTLGLIAPITASAQTVDTSAPAGYQPAAPATASMPGGLGGPAMMAPPAAAAPAAAPAAPVHKHKGKTLCAACAAKQANAMPPGKIVGCAHSSNGVCGPCRAALDMPGTFVQSGAPAIPAQAEAPGRAVASSGAPAMTGMEAGGMEDPTPVGVVRAGYSQSSGPMGMPMQAPMAPGMNPSAPGRAVAEMPVGNDPYQKKGSSFPHPHILGHLFGWSGLGAERREERAWKKSEAHAMLTYDPNAPTAVNELPASAVFGKQK